MNYLIIDLTNLSYRYIDGKYNKTRPNKIAQAVISFKDSSFMEKPYKVICVKDKGRSEFRKALYSEYKANRGKDLTPEQEEARKQFYLDIETAVSYITACDVPVIEYLGVEADDIIAWITINIPHNNMLIISGDSDLTQLDIPQFSLFKNSYISYADSGFETANDYVLCKSIAGDTADNIKGVQGVGLKTSLAMLKKYNTSSIDELINSISKAKKRGKREESVLQNKQLILDNIELISLTKNLNKIITPEVSSYIKEALCL